MKTKHFLLLVLAFIIAMPNYAQKPKKTKIGDKKNSYNFYWSYNY